MTLKELRVRSRLTAEQVAVSLGKSVATIRFWESGKHTPRLTPPETLKLCQLYECSLEELAEASEAS
jgi:transcriptional regulator with XRE-family HTH domain